MTRPAALLALVSGVVTASALLTAVPAAAAAPCIVGVGLADRVMITSRTTPVQASVTDLPGSCLVSATFSVDGPDGPAGDLDFDATGRATLRITARTGPGRYRLVDGTGLDSAGRPIRTADSNTATAKLGSAVGRPTVTGGGRTRTLSARATAYSVAADAFVASPGRTVVFQVGTATGWRTVATARTSRTGTAAARTGATGTRWRAVLSETATSWDAVSPSRTTGTAR